MSQEETVGDLEDAVGYVLKQAAAALRAAMDAALRPLNLTVPQYACLELLRQRPGLSNAELARGAFVSRQATNGVLRGLHERGLVTRPDTAPQGRARPTRLTDYGRQQLHVASAAVQALQKQMVFGLTAQQQHQLRDNLAACAAALTPSPPATAAPQHRASPAASASRGAETVRAGPQQPRSAPTAAAGPGRA